MALITRLVAGAAVRRIVLCIALSIGTLSPLAHSQPSADFFQDTFDQMLMNDPEYATSVGHHEYDDRWTDWSENARRERRQFFEQHSKQLDAQVDDSEQSADRNFEPPLLRGQRCA
jgi:hypothetical protein